MTTDTKAKPFCGVFRPGLYRMREGHYVEVTHMGDDPIFPWCSATRFHDTYDFKGKSSLCDHFDVIAGPLDEPQEMAGLTGFAGVQDGRVIGFATADKAFEYGWEQAIDLSKVPASAIVKPEPKTETRTVRLAILSTGGVSQWIGPFPKGPADPVIVAFVEREINFTHGEGLEADR